MEWIAHAHCYDAHGRALYLLILAGAQVVPWTLDAAVHACVVCARCSFGFWGKAGRAVNALDSESKH